MSRWGPLNDRYAEQRPRKILALDGGGIRGILTLEILLRIETILRERTGRRELRDLIPRFRDYPHLSHEAGDENDKIPLSKDLGRAFLYSRYDAQLSEKGLADLGVSDADPKKVAKLDAVDAMGDLRRIGRAVAEKVSADHFGSFLL